MINLPNPDKIVIDDIVAFERTVIESIDIEYQRFVNPEEAHRVFDYLLELYTSVDYYTFFSLPNIASLSGMLFENKITRRYILNVTERVMLQWPLEERLVSIIDHVADRYSRTKMINDATIMPTEIRESLATNKEVLKQALSRDVWLLIVFYIALHFHSTKIYQIAIKT